MNKYYLVTYKKEKYNESGKFEETDPITETITIDFIEFFKRVGATTVLFVIEITKEQWNESKF